MYMANILHPDRCHFDVMEEAGNFYRKFYDMDFSLPDVNRSFSKPSGNWQWADDIPVQEQVAGQI